MGIDMAFGAAFAKAQLGAGQKLPKSGTIFISVADRDKAGALLVAGQFRDLGFNILATRGTASFLNAHEVGARMINKVSLGRPHVIDAIKNGEIQFVINTGLGDESKRDGYLIRRAAIKYNLPYVTTIAGAIAMSKGIGALKAKRLTVQAIQEYYK